MQIDLPEFEKTLVTLAVELLSIPQEFSNHVLAPSEGQREAERKESMRMSLPYLSALLAYGFSMSYPAVRTAADWFNAPFPTEQSDRIDMTEMNRLEALLSVRPVHESVTPRLRQLMNQMTPDGQFNLGSSNIYFSTLWSLKVLNMARRANLLEGLITVERLRELVDDYLQPKLAVADKDLALALNLRYELFGGLTDDQRNHHLQKLIDNWHRNSGLWNVASNKVWIPDSINKLELSVADLRVERESFYDMILSTCYVVENLAPLIDLYTEVGQILRGSIKLWWSVLYQDPIWVLRELFPLPEKSLEYVTVLARTLIMLRAFFNEPLMGRVEAHTYDELLQSRSRLNESNLSRSLSEVLKQFIDIVFEDGPKELRYGLSGANVVRVHPYINNWDDQSKLKLADSLIIKYGTKADIDAERASYKKLPDSIQPSYVDIPRDTYTDSHTGITYVVMRDLHNYKTLVESMRASGSGQIVKALIRELPGFLLHSHQGGERELVSAPTGIIQDLYLLPMQVGMSTIFKCLGNPSLIIEESVREEASDLYLRLNERCAELLRRQSQLEKFPKAYMHGDLHSRNIMIRQNTQRNHTNQELDFKLIDLEKFSVDGDAAMDLGELLVDLDLLRIDIRNRSDSQQHPLAILGRTLSDEYHTFALNRHDDLFEVRVPLAQARFSIRIAKGKARQIDPAQGKNKSGSTEDTVRAILHHSKKAADYLREVLEKIGSGTSTPPFVSLPEEER